MAIQPNVTNATTVGTVAVAVPKQAATGTKARQGRSPAPRIDTHRKESIDFYEVSEDQLMLLESSQRDLTLEILWIGMGAAIGSFPTSLLAVLKYLHTPAYVFAGDELIQLMIFCGAMVACVVSTAIYRRRSKTAKSIFEEIRAQKKVKSG